jgi:hypothetical protein
VEFRLWKEGKLARPGQYIDQDDRNDLRSYLLNWTEMARPLRQVGDKIGLLWFPDGAPGMSADFIMKYSSEEIKGCLKRYPVVVIGGAQDLRCGSVLAREVKKESESHCKNYVAAQKDQWMKKRQVIESQLVEALLEDIATHVEMAQEDGEVNQTHILSELVPMFPEMIAESER